MLPNSFRKFPESGFRVGLTRKERMKMINISDAERQAATQTPAHCLSQYRIKENRNFSILKIIMEPFPTCSEFLRSNGRRRPHKAQLLTVQALSPPRKAVRTTS